MVHVRRILKDHRDSGSVASLLSLWGFVDDRTFLTKAGALGVVFRLRGVDDDCLDHAERRSVTLRFEQALRHLDESFRVYQYLVKQPAGPFPMAGHAHPVVDEALRRRGAYLAWKASGLFEIETYVVVLYEGWTSTAGARGLLRFPRTSLRARFSARDTIAHMDHEMNHAVRQLHQKAHAFSAQLEDSVAPTPLGKAEVFRFLRRLLNYAPHKGGNVALKHDTHLDFYVSDSEVECHRDHLRVDGYRVKALTMKEPPTKTFAHMLRDLCGIPCPFIACLEWQRLSNAKIRREIHARRRHFFNRKVSLVNYLGPQTKSDEMLVDESATTTVQELGQSLTEMDVHGRFFGAASLTLVLYDGDAHRLNASVADAIKAFAGHDGVLYEESYNLLNTWLAVVPGNASHNLRRLALLNTNVADLSFLFTLDTGEPTSAHLDHRNCLAVFETPLHTPYYWNLHHHDVGHSLIQGATGSGKSFLTSFIITHAQQYDPVTFIFDLGGGYDGVTTRLGGSTWRMGLSEQPFTINPFCLPPVDEHLHFLFSFVRVLLQSGGQYHLTLQDDREVYDAITSLYALDPAQRRLLTLVNLLPRPLAQYLHRWVQGGPYAAFFDHVEDTLTFRRIQSFDFEGLERFPQVLEPLLFYVLHRASDAIRDRSAASTLKLFVLDEAWRFARDATVKQYITEALKTWRKRNASMILATQSTEDFPDHDLLRTVLENCPTKFFLANPGIDTVRARELFHLNHTEVARIVNLQPRQQALMKRPGLSKVIDLNVEPESRWIYANTAAPERSTSRAADVCVR